MNRFIKTINLIYVCFPQDAKGKSFLQKTNKRNINHAYENMNVNRIMFINVTSTSWNYKIHSIVN